MVVLSWADEAQAGLTEQNAQPERRREGHGKLDWCGDRSNCNHHKKMWLRCM